MNALKLCAIPMLFAAAQVLAQVQSRPPENPTQDPAAQSAEPATGTRATDPSVNMGRNPRASTQQTEGTTENHRAPTAPPPRDAALMGPNDMGAMPQPSTGESESAAVDREGSKRANAPAQTQVAAEPAIAGTPVVTAGNQPLGSVVETVFDSRGQPSFVVISVGENMAAVPYQTAASMMSGQKIVVDPNRLTQAPKVAPGEWRDTSRTGWQTPSTRYWNER
jgi:hypothetical protein